MAKTLSGVAALLMAAVLAGCGGGGGGNRGTLRAKHKISPDAQRQAKSMLLKLSDFPDGWRASAGAQDVAGQRKFRKCIGVNYADLTLTGDATSKDFAMGESTTANSEAQI